MNKTESLKGKLALITGCSGGIGRVSALALANHGCSIAVHYNASKGKASDIVTQLKISGVNAVAFQADLSQYNNVRKLYADVVAQMGPVDILFNNSGVTNTVIGPQGNIQDLSIDEFESTWRTNTGSSYLLTQLCIPHMLEQKWGRVIFCSSVAAGTGGIIGPHYASSKSAMHGLMHWISMRYAKDGVTCNAIAPALIKETTMMANVPDELVQRIPVGRFGLPEDIASVVEMLVLNSYMTNKIIVADGGWTAGAF
ncbi:hypothetical protein HYPSUDRAFT_170644 [Hypholoma sublateritium FD-334 SS-4]|uniref:3-oxoacyl-[acyl-carrier-protein] reductase n=1 Tax=Hypholoma sublateritium (strain FD-334 SS-4) TaxID=945553 RepID=A0A0D2M2E0_HYPSF|nr:hypothetical protein HYPSUDRAFT_170644 [Hypholoma sublateritium FD-334 SS-4]